MIRRLFCIFGYHRWVRWGGWINETSIGNLQRCRDCGKQHTVQTFID